MAVLEQEIEQWRWLTECKFQIVEKAPLWTDLEADAFVWGRWGDNWTRGSYSWRPRLPLSYKLCLTSALTDPPDFLSSPPPSGLFLSFGTHYKPKTNTNHPASLQTFLTNLDTRLHYTRYQNRLMKLYFYTLDFYQILYYGSTFFCKTENFDSVECWPTAIACF